MISNTAQINTFVGGLNLDADVNMIPDNQYRYALDVRVVTNDGGTTGVLQSIENPRKYNTAIPADEVIIGTTTINDIAVVITKLPNGINKIYRVSNFDTNTPQIKLVCKGKLGLCLNLTKTPTLSVVGNYESDTNIKIYFTDGKSPVKILNIMSDDYVSGSNLVDTNGNMINPGALDIIPDARLTPLKFIKLETGNLNSGVVTYCYQLFNVHGTETVTSQLSELIHLTESTTNNGSLKYKGTGLNKSANKAVVLSALLNVNDFGKARIIRIHYTKNNNTPSIIIVDEIDITPNQTKLIYADYGSSYLSELSVDEFNALTGYQFLAQTLENTQNRLFAANITEQSWIPKGSNGKPYDARAYRANSSGTVVLQSAANDNILLFYLNDTNALNNVPQSHDCINPFNSVNFSECLDIDKYIYDRDGILGGSGINIEYSFVTTDIKLSKRQGQYRLDLDCTMDVPSERINNIYVTRQGGSSYVYATSVDTEYLKNPIIPNYADPYIDANFRGYQRDEIYRFGIVFYNNKNIASPVLWIGDIRMPHSNQMPPFKYENNTLIGKALGLEFFVKNMPEDAVSYEIVRCDRTESDRTIVMQAVGSLLHEYSIQEQDKIVGQGSKLSNSIEMRPMPFFCSYLSDMAITTDARSTVISPTSFRKDYIRLVSPEICIYGNESIRLFKDDCYLDIQGSYYSPFEGGKGRRVYGGVDLGLYDAEWSPFASANLIVLPDNTTSRLDIVTTINWATVSGVGGYVNISLPFKNIDGNIVYYQPIIAKYFEPSYSTDRTGLVQIVDIKYPPNIDYNTTTGVIAYNINIGERTYTNYSMSDFENPDGQSVMGPAGPCVIAYTPNLSNIFSGFPQSIEPNEIAYDYVNAVPVFNIKRISVTQYGGNTFSSRSNSVYISTGSLVSSNSIVFGGDTYLSLLDYPNTMIYQLPEQDKWNDMKFFIASYIPFESSINMNLFHGDQVHRSYLSGFNQIDPYLQLEPTQMGNFHVQDMPYFVYNSVYSTLNTGKLYVPNSMYAEENQYYPNRILSSQAKTTNEVIDQWSKFKVADYLDVDNQYGAITNLKVFKDKLFYFQDSGVGIAAINERSLITDDNVNQIVLGTGGILARFDYVTNTNGSSIINDKTIVNSDNVLYWYDCDKNEICAYTGQVSLISKEKQVQSYFNTNIREDRTKGMSLFDKKYNEVWFNILNKPLVFNEQLGRFTSFYTFNPKWSLPISDRVVTIKDNYFHTLHDTGVNGLELIDRESKLEIVVNKDYPYTKVYDNVRFQGNFKDTNGNPVIVDIIDHMKMATKNQQAVKESPITFDYREDTFRFPVPRADKNEDTLSLPARLRGKYMICDYDLDSNMGHTFEIPQITTTYRYSLI